MKCPKCGYARTFGETAPEWQCPSCGVAYAKASADRGGETRVQQRSGSGGAKFVKFLIVVFAVAVVWALVPGKRQGPGPARQGDFVNAGVIMYSLTTCGYCDAKRAELHAKGIPFVEYFIDTDQARLQELSEKLHAAGFQGGAFGTPSLEVNGKMLPNNPPIETIIKHL